jgi:hypothetical protein
VVRRLQVSNQSVRLAYANGVLKSRPSEQRARVSDKTIRVLSNRRTLRDAFKERLRKELDNIGIHLVQVRRVDICTRWYPPSPSSSLCRSASGTV